MRMQVRRNEQKKPTSKGQMKIESTAGTPPPKKITKSEIIPVKVNTLQSFFKPN